ncbi:DUF6457 domain-containing protein [Corynebacterium crudilactis]|uniref:Molybdopterin-guanine dinucleotide biosyn n=1 Tax=Corynebacterium crudilactis TaxID=1652495 RepID=A0A172QX77_9CORY|nr:DUF6457 domain-containing protein [Corynebacterium crudilactis]ANE05246.1 molybdopterin-guanine dinucleotide biosyn [Corynebacterium crudilactis]
MQRMYQWLNTVCAELDIDAEILPEVVPHLLNLTRDIAHGPSRPAAPMTSFLLGLAAGRSGISTEDWSESTLLNARHLQEIIAQNYPEDN